jgi:transcriptional regulator with XRE-family HTH domain
MRGEEAGLATIGRWVKDARRRAQMTQQHVENVSGVDQTIISRLENGRLLSLKLVRLAAVVAAVTDPRPRPDRWS